VAGLDVSYVGTDTGLFKGVLVFFLVFFALIFCVFSGGFCFFSVLIFKILSLYLSKITACTHFPLEHFCPHRLISAHFCNKFCEVQRRLSRGEYPVQLKLRTHMDCLSVYEQYTG
jgi:hypothetical protein